MERNVAVIVETSNSYARGVLRGIYEYARTCHGWTLYLTEHGRHEFDELFVCNWKFDGVIARIETDQMAWVIKDMDVPTVDVSAARLIQGIPWVETDDDAITRLALDHLRDCGLQNFAFFGDPFYNWSIWRQQGFKRILGRPDIIQSRIFNLPARKEPRVQWWTQREAIRDWLESLPKPVGIFACYDACGQQLLEICRHFNLKVPEDVAVIGVDNDELLCELATPSMSSVIPNSLRAGAYAAEILGSHDGRGKAPGAQVLHRTPRRAQTRFNRRPGCQRSSRRQSNRLHPAEGPRAHQRRGCPEHRSPFPARSRGPVPTGAQSHAAPGDSAREDQRGAGTPPRNEHVSLSDKRSARH